MSLVEERRIADTLGRELGLEFQGRRFELDGWGQADNYALIQKDLLILLEVETSQKHPSTNVLKVWPYLEKHAGATVVLVQVFRTAAKNEKSSRGQLAAWVARRIKRALAGRFYYYRLLCESDGRVMGELEDLRVQLSNLRAAKREGDRSGSSA